MNKRKDSQVISRGLVLASIILIGASLGCKLLGGSSLKGGYVGRVTIMAPNSSGQTTTQIAENVFALVTEEADMRTVNFSDTGLISNCKLQVESQSKYGELARPQPCEVNVNGNTEFLKVNELRFTGASGVGPGGIIIEVRGRSSEGDSIWITFTGLPKT